MSSNIWNSPIGRAQQKPPQNKQTTPHNNNKKNYILFYRFLNFVIKAVFKGFYFNL